jgi:hypothetical protein
VRAPVSPVVDRERHLGRCRVRPLEDGGISFYEYCDSAQANELKSADIFYPGLGQLEPAVALR